VSDGECLYRGEKVRHDLVMKIELTDPHALVDTSQPLLLGLRGSISEKISAVSAVSVVSDWTSPKKPGKISP